MRAVVQNLPIGHWARSPRQSSRQGRGRDCCWHISECGEKIVSYYSTASAICTLTIGRRHRATAAKFKQPLWSPSCLFRQQKQRWLRGVKHRSQRLLRNNPLSDELGYARAAVPEITRVRQGPAAQIPCRPHKRRITGAAKNPTVALGRPGTGPACAS